MIKTIFFDFDGVITIDTKGSLSFANYIVSKTGLDKDFFLAQYRHFGADLLTGKKNHLDIWPELCQKLKTDINPQLIEAAFRATPINQEVIELAEDLKAQGYQLGLITDNKNDRMQTLIEQHQWQDLFDVLAISAKVGSRKNEATFYRYALEKAAIQPEEGLFIDNTLENLAIPKDLGFHTIYFDDQLKDVLGLKAVIQQQLADN